MTLTFPEEQSSIDNFGRGVLLLSKKGTLCSSFVLLQPAGLGTKTPLPLVHEGRMSLRYEMMRASAARPSQRVAMASEVTSIS